MSPTRPPGRPKVAARDKRSVRFTVSLTPDEAEEFMLNSDYDTLSRAGRVLFLEELDRMAEGAAEYAAWKASMDAKYGPRDDSDEPPDSERSEQA